MVVERRRAINGTATFSIRVSPELKARLEQLAYERRKSLCKLVGDALEEIVKESEC